MTIITAILENILPVLDEVLVDVRRLARVGIFEKVGQLSILVFLLLIWGKVDLESLDCGSCRLAIRSE